MALRRRNAFVKALAPACWAPYPIRLYRRFLEGAIEQRAVSMRSFCAPAHEQAASLYVRHDIDTADCAHNMEALLEVDSQLGVGPGIYFRADEEAYRLSLLRSRIEPYREAGFEIGLHTVCYAKDDYLAALQEEIRTFTDAFGFAPSSFTVHGLGAYRHDVREQFYGEICSRLGEFGFRFSDCCAKQRVYDYVFHDSHLDLQRRERFICNDLADGGFPFVAGKSYVVLTHPCYWSGDGRAP